MTTQTDVKIEFISDTTAGTSTYVASGTTVLPPEYNIPIMNNSFFNGSARQLVIDTDPGAEVNSVVVVGTDSNDRPLTETIPLPIAGGIIPGEKYFKTIESATGVPGDWTGRALAIGMLNTIVQSIPGRTRLKAYTIAYGTTEGIISFFDGPTVDDTLSFQTSTYESSNLMLNFSIPGEGILYENGLTVLYPNTASRMMNLYYG